jgi:hypothetical protein
MKNFRISLKNVAMTVACFAVSIMLFTGCEKDDPAPEPDNGIAEIGKTYVSTSANAEKVYTLKVSKNLTRSSAAATDTYVLLYVDKSGEVKTSTGVVTSSVGESLTLTPTGGTPFTVNVTANGITGISGNITFTDNSTTTGGSLTPFANGEIEITGTAITEDRVLGVPGMAVNYVYNGTRLLAIGGSKTLTILPGTTIRFTQTGGGIEVKEQATVKILGEDKLRELDATGNLSATPGTKSGHVTLKGGAQKGSWRGIEISTIATNELNYVEILNAGSNHDISCALYLNNGKTAMTNSLIDNSAGNGITFRGQSNNTASELTIFTGNTIKNCDKAPIYGYEYAGIYPLRNLSNANPLADWTGNANPYIHITIGNSEPGMTGDMTVHALAGYPWYFSNGWYVPEDRNVTIEAGAVILMGAQKQINVPATSHLIAEGTATARITVKGLQDNAGYWRGIKILSQTPGTKFNYCDISGGGSGGDGNDGSNLYCYAGINNASYVALNNTAFSKSLHYGLKLNSYAGGQSYMGHTYIQSSNPASVTFSQCPDGNIWSNCTGKELVYTTLSEHCDVQ